MHAESNSETRKMTSAAAPTRMSRESNSYDFVRFVAAAMVLYSHHFALVGQPEPLVPGLGEKYGAVAVYIFFVLSGFLIYRSLERNADWWRFISARFLRIVPNLTVALVLTSLITLVWFSNYGNIIEHVKYVVRGLLLVLVGPGYYIKGVFEVEGLADSAVNGPLWSLRYEIHLYLVLFLIVTFAGRFRGWIFAAALPLLMYHWATDTKPHYILYTDLFEYSRLGQIFLSGALLGYLWKYWERFAVPLGFAGLALCFAFEALIPFNSFLNALALGLAIIGLGSSSVMSWFSKGGDGSYGMYIYAWPIQQFSIMLIPAFWPSMLVAFLATTAIGYTTWHLFEKRCMGQVSRMAAWLRGLFQKYWNRQSISAK
jgi:peptidoglycan/LPS O-acetylase OafA/YrhL